MKKYLSLLLALLLLLPGCGTKPQEEDSTTAQDAETILRVMLAGRVEQDDTLAWYREPSEVEGYVKDYYKLADLALLDGAVVRIEGARAFELAVLQVNEADVETVTEALQQYLLNRQGSFTGYFPDEASMAENGRILTRGGWVALDVCIEMEAAKNAFESCFGKGVNAVGIPAVLGPQPDDYRPDGRLIYVDPDQDDMTLFNNSAILSAWKSGDDSGLSRVDKKVLDAAKRVWEDWTSPDMSSYEKELALYAWLTTHVSYDQSHYGKKGAPRSSYEPYGPLIEGKGVCLGYAETFRLFMDMADIECITVTGAAFGNRENHAWNMVKLNSEWYCVDPTWDHNGFDGGLQEFLELDLLQFYNYFNVTSQYMADTDHQWDYDNTPEATAEDGGRP